MPDTTILTDEQVAEIEARRARVPPPPWTVALHDENVINVFRLESPDVDVGSTWGECETAIENVRLFIEQAPADINALCVTVQTLRADAKAEMDRESRLVTSLEEAINEIRDQLAAVTQERDALRDNMMRLGRAKAREEREGE